MTGRTQAAALVMLMGSVALVGGGAAGDIVVAVRTACSTHNFALAEREIQTYRSTVGATADLAEAISWLARGTLDDRQYDRAEAFAADARNLSMELLKRDGKATAGLGTALGAAIEVRAEVLAARGQQPQALAYLKTELAFWHETPIAARIQKNINLLALEGRPAPALDISHWVGPRPAPLATLKGHPVLLFFWAHWCGDCKGEVPILARLMQTYGPKGLTLVGPTQLYGYTAEGEATPAVETKYIDEVRRQYYSALGNMSAPVSNQNFQKYGCSTTPTLVLLDRNGIVRMYHPGAMTYDALATIVKKSLAAAAPRP